MGALPKVGSFGTQLVVDASLALLVLVVTTTLSVYKPWGPTRYGQRKQQEQERGEVLKQSDNEIPFGLKIFLAVIGVFVLTILLMHFTGHSLHHGQ